MGETNEHLLIDQARDDPAAFAALYERYIRRIYGFVFRQVGSDALLAQDITAATFEHALKSLRSYQWRSVSFGAWLYKIARNEIRQHFRRKALTKFVDTTFTASHTDLEQAAQTQQEYTVVHAALSKLSQRDRELITLRYFEELSHAEIAEVLGCSVQNVYVRLHRALNRLRKQLELREEHNYVSR
jgi:RNA polymerase sigma-70 factor (ECF subfamily)